MYRLWDIAFDGSTVALFCYAFNASTEGQNNSRPILDNVNFKPNTITELDNYTSFSMTINIYVTLHYMSQIEKLR